MKGSSNKLIDSSKTKPIVKNRPISASDKREFPDSIQNKKS